MVRAIDGDVIYAYVLQETDNKQEPVKMRS